MAKFTVDTHLFRELGELLVGRDSTALVELVKNAYDADATQVTVFGERLNDPDRGRIIVTDNGTGMTSDVFDEGFLRVASRLNPADSRSAVKEGPMGALRTEGIVTSSPEAEVPPWVKSKVEIRG